MSLLSASGFNIMLLGERSCGKTSIAKDFLKKQGSSFIALYLVCFILLLTFLYLYICALRDLIPFVQSKKREKLPWRSVTL